MISTLDILELVILVITVVVGVAGNVIIIIIFTFGGRGVRVFRNFQIVSLSVADLLIASIIVPIWILERTNTKYLSPVSLQIYTAFDVMFGSASIFNLTAISLERLHAIKSPLHHINLTRGPYIIAITVSWIGGLSLFFMKFLHDLTKKNTICIFTMSLFLFVYMVPVLIITLAYSLIFFYAYCKPNHIRRSTVFERQQFQRELKVAKTIGVLVGLFILCWTPFFIMNLIETCVSQLTYKEKSIFTIQKHCTTVIA